MGNKVVLWIELHVKPENRDRFIEVATANAKHSAEDEPENVDRFDFLQDATDPNTFYYYEVYTGEEGHHRHETTPHRVKYGKDVEGLIESRGNIRRAVDVWTNYA
jgi:quinol monooxygenase YgiN